MTEEEGHQENQRLLRSGLKYDLYIVYKNNIHTLKLRTEQDGHCSGLPLGLLSKKRMGARSTAANSLLWSTREALTQMK